MSFRRALVTAALLSLLAIDAGTAQETPEIDQKRIEREISEISPDVQRFAAEVAERADEYADQARELSDRTMAGLGTGVEVGDTEIDSILALAPQISEAREQAAQQALGVIVFASFSMDDAALRSLVVDARRAGVPIMLRGFVDGSLSTTAQKMRSLLGEIGEGHEASAEFLGGVVIDPRAFRVFEIEHVPTFIALDGPLPDCDGLDCSAPPPPHDRLSGNMSLQAALQALASEGREASAQAHSAYLRLEGRS